MATVDEDIAQLEKDLRQLKIDYEQYFGGGKSRPPTDVEWRIDIMIKRYADRGAAMSYQQRFHYGNLTQTYVKYREMFRKRLKQKEEGTIQRHYGSAAREIEREREARRRIAAKNDGSTQLLFAMSCKDPDQEKRKVVELYAAFRNAKERVGEAVENLTFESFQQFVRQKTDQLKEQTSASEVEYVVILEGKQALLKARVKS